ncbi:hypothetical protein GDO78_017001 [Eleutherodactylus coqui]|uniref:Uncharacterized protein n=1 Tax=Eleutherodactylus coqui TaxID=57060 RepID=A0A8J6BE75_ELECQ|nr:hypothetical protein GDO78_017001 [Eleutherodactylus coqui]
MPLLLIRKTTETPNRCEYLDRTRLPALNPHPYVVSDIMMWEAAHCLFSSNTGNKEKLRETKKSGLRFAHFSLKFHLDAVSSICYGTLRWKYIVWMNM